MNSVSASPIIVKRGFFSALVYGVSGMVITGIICGSAIGLYGLNILDRRMDNAVAMAKEVFASLPAIQKALPPVLSDALNDRRDADYRSQLEISSKLVQRAPAEGHRNRRDDAGCVVLTVKNNGNETVSLLALRIALLDENQVPVRDIIYYAATPLAIDDDMPGPLLPGSDTPRKFRVPLLLDDKAREAEVDVADIRVWKGPANARGAEGDEAVDAADAGAVKSEAASKSGHSDRPAQTTTASRGKGTAQED